MNKKLLTALVALTLIVPTTSHAALKNRTVTPPTLAILDTAIDMSIPSFKDKVIYEVCILEWTTCPNGTSFMEGPGSATLPHDAITKNGFAHGTQMVSAALKANPNLKIVFIRIVGQNINFDRQISTENTVLNALNWVYSNKDRLNIQAVSMSQGDHNLGSGTNYCLNTPRTESSIKQLVQSQIPVFFAIGNGYDYKRIDWPACLTDSVAVGAGSKNGIELWNNFDQQRVDFFANGKEDLIYPGNKIVRSSGTSISTQVVAAQWMAIKASKPNLTMSQIYDLISKTSRPISGKMGTGKLVDLTRALNG
jgi:hypothetical protein